MATCMQRAQSTTSRIVFCSKTYLFTFDNDSLRCSVSHILVTYEPTSNRSTRSSKAVAMLRATRKYRWRLTGTPVTNTLADIYGLIRDWEDFNAYYIAKVQLEDAPLAGLRAQEVLKPLLLRRMKGAQLEGRPLLQLPEKDIELVMLDFSEEERELYDSFEKRAQIQINRFIRVGVQVLILRLRRLCCHPHVILNLMEGFEDPTLVVSSDNDKEVARANKLLGAQWVMEVKKRCLWYRSWLNSP
ncbi:hypothetical protein SCP_1900040 [Sparassis crispa]|uniref:SNF2 N-terminal domain-containing protein n=1 Tax=Sparassis crispa TaxID=139825 RepID=A0A401H6U4_9APHY|nr:hypothetical protein SCP_1900040 [Sparassis crispa]GBE90155.1 hypothetical protein SCP_1900040 [Sparassis crispa]